jgi:hypothetical protein
MLRSCGYLGGREERCQPVAGLRIYPLLLLLNIYIYILFYIKLANKGMGGNWGTATPTSPPSPQKGQHRNNLVFTESKVMFLPQQKGNRSATQQLLVRVGYSPSLEPFWPVWEAAGRYFQASGAEGGPAALGGSGLSKDRPVWRLRFAR